jgi:hypothetical protein
MSLCGYCLGLDAIFGTYAHERDEVALAIGRRKQYPWKGTNIFTGTRYDTQLSEDQPARHGK